MSSLITTGFPDLTITSDASGSWGYGAWYESKWFRVGPMDGKHIAVLELIPINIATIIWGPSFTGKRMLANCGNSAAVSVLNTRYGHDKSLMQLLHSLFFIKTHFKYH